MSRCKKDGVYFNIKFKRNIYNRLIRVSEEADQSKTLIVERTLDSRFNDYKENQAILLEHPKSRQKSAL